MKINSKFLRGLANNDFFLDDIECINFFTYWDLMVFPSWWTNLNFGKKISVKVYKLLLKFFSQNLNLSTSQGKPLDPNK